MATTKWHDWAQVAGIFALVGSLIFVGLQMQQTQKIALAEQYQARAEAAQAMYLAQLETGESILVFAQQPAEQWTPEQFAMGTLISSWAWTQYDNHHYQYQAGFLDEEAWTGAQARILSAWESCTGHRLTWVYHRAFLRASFVNYVESLNDPCTRAG